MPLIQNTGVRNLRSWAVRLELQMETSANLSVPKNKLSFRDWKDHLPMPTLMQLGAHCEYCHSVPSWRHQPLERIRYIFAGLPMVMVDPVPWWQSGWLKYRRRKFSEAGRNNFSYKTGRCALVQFVSNRAAILVSEYHPRTDAESSGRSPECLVTRQVQMDSMCRICQWHHLAGLFQMSDATVSDGSFIRFENIHPQLLDSFRDKTHQRSQDLFSGQRPVPGPAIWAGPRVFIFRISASSSKPIPLACRINF